MSGGCSPVVAHRPLSAVASRLVLAGTRASVVAAHGLTAPWHVGSAQTRDWTCVPCIGRRFLTTGLSGKSNTPIFTGTARVKSQPTISQFECATWARLFSLPSPLKCVTYLWGPSGAEPNGLLTALAYFRSEVIRYSSVSDSITEDVWWCYVLTSGLEVENST